MPQTPRSFAVFPAIPQGSDVLIALKRSHLLAKVATMASGTRQGGRPRLLYFDLGKLGRGPRRGGVCAAAGLVFAMALAGGDLACRSAENPLRHGALQPPGVQEREAHVVAWRVARQQPGQIRPPGRQGRGSQARAGARARATDGRLLEGIYHPCRPRRRQGDRMARDFATVMSASGTPGRAIVGLHFAKRSRQGPQGRHGGFRHRLAR